MPTSLPLFAEAAQGVLRTTFEWGRIQSNTDFVLPSAVFVAVGVLVWAVYRRDAVELHPMLAWLLVGLRTIAFLGLLVFYLQPQWRTERDVTQNSRAVLLVDTSRSMGRADDGSSPAEEAKTRIARVADTLAETDFLKQLRKTHDVVVAPFDDDLGRDRIMLRKSTPNDSEPKGSKTGDPETTADTSKEPTDWHEFLAPGGTETQLGAALQQIINDENGKPLAGIVVLTDGGQNAGVSPEAAIALAGKANIPIFPVGIGSDKRPVNVRISDLVAPARAYPGDSYKVTGFVQSQGMADREIEVELSVRKPGSAGEDDASGDIQRRQVILGGDGEVVPVEFELTPQETGLHTLRLDIAADEDHGGAGNFREVDVEIVDHKNRVLLFAGGPTREYRFVRTLLYRDRSTTVDVVLQTARPGISQEADKLLDNFPTTREELFGYDCVLAFDPDWQAIATSENDTSPVELLEEWVAEQGGGLVVVAGPVFAGAMVGGWVDSEDPAMATVRKLYPVTFPSTAFATSALSAGTYVSEDPWKIEFSREGLEAEYLWLEDTATAGRQAWEVFEGAYGCCRTHEPKLGATVLARFSDPRAGIGGGQPIFFAEQFYGSGRVFYLGSGEMWRLRQLDETYFDRFYTKLLRHVSQGRLLRGSTRGVLSVDRDRYLLGGTVEVRTQLTDARMQPLAVPRVMLQVVRPDGAVQGVALQPDAARVGTYAGRFPVVEEGSYRLELEIPESGAERLVRRIQVKIPDLERENPQRNDPLLKHIAEGTEGQYYVGLAAMLDGNGGSSVVDRLPDRTETIVMTAVPNPLWKETWRRWLILALCGLLCLEWLIRRLLKLA